ncbi:MAG: glycosyltransferase family 39 protein [Nanoarchaeota archaeon]
MKIKPLRILAIIFLLSLVFNLYLSFSSPYLNNDDSYFNLRVIENIRNTGLPIIYDELSYGGRFIVVQPLFHYLFALFSFIPFYFKIFPAIMTSSLVLISYFIAKEITNDETSSLFTALLSGFIPLYSIVLINQFTPYFIVLPLTAFLLFCFMRLENKKYLIYFIVGSSVLVLMHPYSFLLIFILLFYVLLMNAEGIPIIKLKKEIMIFTLFLVLLINIIIFRRVFLEYGIHVVYGNNPLSNTLNIFKSIYLIGIIPLCLGILGVYQGFFKMKKESIILISSLILGILFLLLIGMINIDIGLLFLSFGLVIASSLSIKFLFIYLEKTKFNSFKNFVIIGFVFFIFLLSLVPTYISYNKEFTNLNDFKWLKENSESDEAIIAPLEYGHMISYFSRRKNIIDSNFLLAPDPKQRSYDVNLMYTGWSYNKALEISKEYNAEYIYINDNIKKFYNIQDLKYVQDGKCITKVKENIYKVIC